MCFFNYYLMKFKSFLLTFRYPHFLAKKTVRSILLNTASLLNCCKTKLKKYLYFYKIYIICRKKKLYGKKNLY